MEKSPKSISSAALTNPCDQVLSFTSIKNYIASALGMFATQGMAYTMFSSFLMLVYTDYLGISSAAIGGVMAAGVFIDMISDLLMGVVADRVRTKWGKVKHWFFWMAVPVAITIGLMWMVPVSASDGLKLVWAFVIYNLYCTFLTGVRLPAYMLQHVASDNAKVRSFVLWGANVGANFASTITAWMITPIVGGFADELTGYRALSWIMAGITLVLILIAGLCITEKRNGADLARIEQDRKELNKTEKSMSLFQQFSYLLRNKYWLGFQLSNLMASISLGFMIGSMGYFAKYVLGPTGYGGENAFGVLGTVMNVPMLIAPFVLLPLLALLDAKKIVVLSNAIGAVAGLITWANGLRSWPVFVVTMVIAQFVGSFYNGSANNLLGRAIDYGEWKFGVRQEGLGSSFSSALRKVASGIATAILGVVLAAAGYKAGVMPEDAQNAILFMFMGLPAIAKVLGTICFIFLSLDDKKWGKIRAELDARAEADKAKDGAQ